MSINCLLNTSYISGDLIDINVLLHCEIDYDNHDDKNYDVDDHHHNDDKNCVL
jgi:hypothetical protein